MSSLKKIPFILVHLNQEIRLSDELKTIQSAGTIPYCVILSDKLKDEELGNSAFPILWTPEKKVGNKICEVLLEIQHSGIDFDQILIYQDDSAASTQDILQGIYFASYEPDAFHIIEMEDSIHKQPASLLFITEKIFGTRLDEPTPYLWIIPATALKIFTQSGKNPRYFPLSWLNACHRENIPIRVSFLDKASEGIHSHRTFTQARIIFYSLGLFFRYLFSSLIGLIADNAMFFLLDSLGQNHLCSLIISRIFSMLINYSLLRIVVFREKGNRYGSLLRYIGLVIFSGSIVWASLEIGTKYFAVHSIIIKMAVEMVMFFFNYSVSKKVVFPFQKKEEY
ncbi:MAG: GtrA family protein [Flexilinea sp.]